MKQKGSTNYEREEEEGVDVLTCKLSSRCLRLEWDKLKLQTVNP